MNSPVLASGGVIIPPDGYYKSCHEICKKHDVLFMADEVVTSFGRLGNYFASEEVFEVVPDMITTAKGLTSGYIPMGALFISDRLIEQITASSNGDRFFTSGFTYSGHPVATAASMASLDIIENEHLLERVRDIAPYFTKAVHSFAQNTLEYSNGLDQAGFVASGINYDATLRNLELIGEAATRIPKQVQEKYPEIAWRQIIATRKRLIHGYLGIDDDNLWSTA